MTHPTHPQDASLRYSPPRLTLTYVLSYLLKQLIELAKSSKVCSPVLIQSTTIEIRGIVAIPSFVSTHPCFNQYIKSDLTHHRLNYGSTPAEPARNKYISKLSTLLHLIKSRLFSTIYIRNRVPAHFCFVLKHARP